jgi:capsular polysaccharide transport system ATP-binding protein
LTVHRGERLGVVGRNGAGKSTLVRLISGAERPTSGEILRHMTVSWPLAFSGGFQPGLTGADNLRFICRIYGVDFDSTVGFVQDFSELGGYLYEPVAIYSSGMRARLAFAISMVVEFDCYLIDEVIAVGDELFREKCEIELFHKRQDRAMILVSHSFGYLRDHCTRFVLFRDGRLEEYSDANEVRLAYKQLQREAAAAEELEKKLSSGAASDTPEPVAAVARRRA